MNIKTTTTPEISSWNNNIFTFGLDSGPFEKDALDAQIEQALVGFEDTATPECEQFTCSSYWPLA